MDKLLTFRHFQQPKDGYSHEKLGVPPNIDSASIEEVGELVQQDYEEAVEEVEESIGEVASIGQLEKYEEEVGDTGIDKGWTYGQARWVGKFLF